jgi:hypothetical protein
MSYVAAGYVLTALFWAGWLVALRRAERQDRR